MSDIDIEKVVHDIEQQDTDEENYELLVDATFARAVLNNDIAQIKLQFLANKNFNPNKADKTWQEALGSLALELAVGHDRPEIVKLLLADPRVDPNLGRSSSPLHRAVFFSHVDVVQLLLAHPGIDVNLEHNYRGDCCAIINAAAAPPKDRHLPYATTIARRRKIV